MKTNSLKELFQESEYSICIDKERKEKALNLLNKEISRTKPIFLYDQRTIIKNQFLYMDKTALWGSIAGSFIMLTMIFLFYNFAWDNREVIVSISISASLLSVWSLAGLSKLFSSNMSELGESCYFNARQMVAFHMTCSGVLNLAVLLVAAVLVGWKWQIAILQTGLYIFVPYVFTQCCCLCSFLTKAGRQNSYVFLVIGIFSSIIFSTVAIFPQLYLTSAMVWWIISFIVEILILSLQKKILFYEMEKGELLCMN